MGSANADRGGGPGVDPELLRQSSESLAGRIIYHELKGFSMVEVAFLLARTNGLSHPWRRAFVRTFLERDLPQLGIRIPSANLERFHYHGPIWTRPSSRRPLELPHDSRLNTPAFVSIGDGGLSLERTASVF
jgi:hypothetical protein